MCAQELRRPRHGRRGKRFYQQRGRVCFCRGAQDGNRRMCSGEGLGNKITSAVCGEMKTHEHPCGNAKLPRRALAPQYQENIEFPFWKEG
jgi:hypothetical protein